MALSEENGNGLVMPVAPMYGGNGGFGGGFGGDWGWIILLLLLAGGNGWGGGFGGGFGNAQLGYDFPWLLNGQNGINANTNIGFQNAMLNDNITGIRDSITSLSSQICNSFNDAQVANLQSIFGVQTALQNCCCENRANIADLKYTVATENCADRQAVSDGIRDVIESNTRNTQMILDKLCAQEIEQLRQSNVALQNQVNMLNLSASQTAQTAQLVADNTAQTQYLVNRISPYPIPAYVVANPVTPATA